MFINRRIIFIDKVKADDDFFCRICSYSLITKNDFDSNKDYKCCYECFLKFVECRKQDWNNGWQPDQEDLYKYLKERKQLSEKIIKI